MFRQLLVIQPCEMFSEVTWLLMNKHKKELWHYCIMVQGQKMYLNKVILFAFFAFCISHISTSRTFFGRHCLFHLGNLVRVHVCPFATQQHATGGSTHEVDGRTCIILMNFMKWSRNLYSANTHSGRRVVNGVSTPICYLQNYWLFCPI